MEIIKLNLIPSGVNPTCHCSQYDNGRVIRIDLFDGLTPYVLQCGDTVTLNVRKPDNTIVTASLTATQGNTYVNLVTTEQICACVGYNLCDLTITNGSVVIGTLNFIMAIERDVLADGIPSQSVIEDLDALVQEAVGDNYYTKSEVDDALDLKADKSTTYTKTETDAALALKANSDNVYTKTETDNALALKANSADVYTKSETDSALALKANSSETYDKAYIDSYLYKKQGKNLYTGLNEVAGYLNANGTIHSSTQDWVTTDFINVEGMDYVTCSALVLSTEKRAKINMYFMCTYNSNKEVLGQDSSNPKTYEVENGVSYIRFSYRSTLYTDFQVENSNEMSDYEPFTYYHLLKDTLVTDWTNKKWCVVGDSLTEINRRTDKHYFDYISEKTNIKIFNMGVGGTGYLRGQDTNIAFYQRISSIPLDSDIITIFGSLNDIGSGAALGTKDDTGTTTIGGCINTTLDNLFAAFPLANVGIVTPTPWDAGQYNPITEPNNSSNYVDLLIAICKKRSIPCLDLYHCSLLRPWDADFRQLAYSKDDGSGVHPNEIGHKLIAPRFMAFLESLLL